MANGNVYRAELEMQASAELNNQISEELLKEDPSGSDATASIDKFIKTEDESNDDRNDDNGSPE